MAQINVLDDTKLRISMTLDDAVAMVREAADHVSKYAHDIITLFEKMPMFEYVHFCFYAFDSAALFEKMIGVDPKAYLSFSLDAPDSFFYALYGGMAGLYEEARATLEAVPMD